MEDREQHIRPVVDLHLRAAGDVVHHLRVQRPFREIVRQRPRVDARIVDAARAVNEEIDLLLPVQRQCGARRPFAVIDGRFAGPVPRAGLLKEMLE